MRNIRRCNLRTNYIEPNKYVLQNMNEYKVCVLYELMSFFLVKVMKINDSIPNLSRRLSLTHKSWINDPLARRWEYILIYYLIGTPGTVHNSFLDKYVDYAFIKWLTKGTFWKILTFSNKCFINCWNQANSWLSLEGKTKHVTL